MVLQGVAGCALAAGEQSHVQGPRCCKIGNADDLATAGRHHNAASQQAQKLSAAPHIRRQPRCDR